MEEIDVTVQRPLEMVVLRDKTGRGGRRVLRLNVDRRVGGRRYALVLVPYTKQEMIGRRTNKTSLAKPFLPERIPERSDEFAWVYDTRAVRVSADARGHKQFVRESRLEVAPETSPWAV